MKVRTAFLAEQALWTRHDSDKEHDFGETENSLQLSLVYEGDLRQCCWRGQLPGCANPRILS